jgi:uncharacterized membrane protein YphA (DoxX/SURF4 family)
MNVALWIVQILLALYFAATGFMKMRGTRENLAIRMKWVADFAPRTIRFIGAVEIVGALGLILPAIPSAPGWFAPVAAVGLGLVMMGAALTHLRRGEYPSLVMRAVLLVLAAFVTYGRFVLVPLHR